MVTGFPWLYYDYYFQIEIVQGEGTTSPAPGSFGLKTFSSDFSFIAIPDEGYVLEKVVMLVKDGADADPTDSYTITDTTVRWSNLKSDFTGYTHFIFQVYFKQVEQFTLGTDSEITTGGYGGGRTDYSPYKELYDNGDQVQLTATPSSGYAFDFWKIYHVPPRNLLSSAPMQREVSEPVLLEVAETSTHTITITDHTLATAYFAPSQQ